jgi:hypothetical protein
VAWVRTPDELFEREDVLAIGLDAVVLHLAALGYSNRNLTDGRVPQAKARTLVAVDEPTALVARLVDAGWWTATDGGYQLVYLQNLQPSRAEVEAKREATARRQARFRDRQDSVSGLAAESDHDAGNGVTASVTNAPSRIPDPVPGPGSPDPVPEAALVGAPAGRSGRAHDDRQVADAPAPRAKPRTSTQVRLAEIVDLVRASGVEIFPTSRDGSALKSCAATAGLIAAAYVAAARREWDPVGDGFIAGNLSLHLVIDRLAGYTESGAGRRLRVDYLETRYGPLMRGPGHNVHGPTCDCVATDAVAF